MHDVRPRRKRKRRVSPEVEKEALRTALYLLGPFIKDVASWNEHGSNAGNPKRELQHAIAFIECVLSDEAADDIPGIEVARKAAIPILKRNQPAARNRWRDQLIVKAIEAVCSRHNLKPTRNPGSRDKEHNPSGCSVVAELFRLLGIKLSEKRITDEIWLKRTPSKR
jgi:hypothetical protein